MATRIENEMSHKNFRAIYTNRDENFYGEPVCRQARFHLTKKAI